MAFKHTYSYEEKEHILMEYLNGTHGFRKLCRIYGMSHAITPFLSYEIPFLYIVETQ